MKKQLPGTDIINDLKRIDKEKKASARKPLMNKIREILTFVKKLVVTLFSLSILGLGIVAIVYAQGMSNEVYRYAVLISGACTVVDGVYLLYKALMSK